LGDNGSSHPSRQVASSDRSSYSRRSPERIPLSEMVPWTAAHFPNKEARDGFLADAANLPIDAVEVARMDEGTIALVRWRPRRFLGLNDIAHAHGGRIVVASRGRG